MNRQQAIEKAKHFRQGKDVIILDHEREAAIYAIEDKDAVMDEHGKVIEPAVKAGQLLSPAVQRKWNRKSHESISLAKKTMRALGCGVALRHGENLPR